MRRLVPFLIAAIMASFPSSFFLLLIGPLLINTSGGGISNTSNYGGAALTGVAASSAVMAYTTAPSRTVASTTAGAVMMASSSTTSGRGLSGATATEVNFQIVSSSTEPVDRISNHGELSLGDNQGLKVEVLGGSPHCSFSMVEFTNTVSFIEIENHLK